MGLSASKVPLAGHVVVITGCDTGFGNETARKLAAIHKLDVADWDAVQAFAERVDSECPEGLYCLLNNAGIYQGSFFTWTSVDEFRKVLDVNLMGALHMMKALVPAMRRFVRQNPTGHAPRIVNITSVAGRATLPSLSPYCTSKYALEALSDSVRMELRAFGIRVALIEPWFASTPMVVGNIESRGKAIMARYQALPHREDYGSDFVDKMVARLTKPPALMMNPITVINALLETIEAQEPRHRRIVGRAGILLVLLYSVFPSWLSDRIMVRGFIAGVPKGAVKNGKQGLLSWL
ncbi:Retinol dehydrogenase 5 [Geranomyces variabilis]|uniref:Retinol dehydrogenase 5 n=1 Tax=Geranomyces variabilis TaxID=109894 RepID=A0AAD5TMX9_9FUNG|nr:Retinol dehydrogenase 5 [Geranomyces variabilis]